VWVTLPMKLAAVPTRLHRGLVRLLEAFSGGGAKQGLWFGLERVRRHGLGWWLSSSSGGGFEVAGDGFGGVRNVLRLCAAEWGVDE
jgi:hypothetical protein